MDDQSPMGCCGCGTERRRKDQQNAGNAFHGRAVDKAVFMGAVSMVR